MEGHVPNEMYPGFIEILHPIFDTKVQFLQYIYAYIYTHKYFDRTYQWNNIQLNISIINNFKYYQFLSMTGLENSEWDSVSFGNRSTYMLSK